MAFCFGDGRSDDAYDDCRRFLARFFLEHIVPSLLQSTLEKHINNFDLMTELSLNNTAVIPCTVDHLGGLGTFAHSLLILESNTTHSTPTPLLPLPPLLFDHSQIQAAYILEYNLSPLYQHFVVQHQSETLLQRAV